MLTQVVHIAGKILIIPLTGILLAGIIFAYSWIYKKYQPPKYNLILISIDTLRADHMGVYGYEKNTTPHIDAWAKDAFVFDKVFTSFPLTYPSIASLLTGISPFESRITNNNYSINEMVAPRVNNSTVTIGEFFKKNGYKTAGYVTNEYLAPNLTNLNKGFDTYEYFKNDKNKDRDYESFIDKALSWLDLNKKNKIFLWLHLIDPHSPYNPPSDLKCKFNNRYCSNIYQISPQELEKNRKKLEGLKRYCSNQPLADDIVNIYETLYDGEVAFTDKIFSKIINRINNNSIVSKNTIIVFIADHGEEFSHNYYFTHGGMLYDSSVKVPLIIKIPGALTSQKRVASLFSQEDIYKIITGLIETSSKNNFSANRFIDTLFSNTRSYVYFSDDAMTKFGITDGRYKYIYTTIKGCKQNRGLEEEFYNRELDKNELFNISQHSDDYKRLKNLLLQKVKQYRPVEIKKIIRKPTTVEEEFGSFSY